MKNTGRYIVLTAFPLGILTAFLAYYSIDVIYWDEWGIASLLDKFYKHTLTFRDIFAPHNEHRIVLGKIIMLLNAIYLHWNLYLEIAVNVLFAAGTSIVMYYASQKMTGLDTKKRSVLYFVSACLIFSCSQHLNYIWGFTMQIFMSVFFNMLALCLLVYGNTACYFIAILSAFTATFSFANGMLIWPIGIIILLLLKISSVSKIHWLKIFLWLAVSVFSVWLYFYDAGSRMGLSERLKYILTHPHMFMILFTCYLGAPISVFRQSAALAAGIFGLALQAFSFTEIIQARKLDRNILFWLGVDLYVLMSAAVTALGRSSSIAATMTRRYSSINMLFWIAVFALLFTALEIRRKVSLKWYVVFACLILSLSVSEENFIAARENYEARAVFKEQIKAGIYDNEHFLREIFPIREGAKIIPLLRKYGVRNFENAPENIVFDDFHPSGFRPDYVQNTGFSCGIDDIKISDGEFLTLTGWWKIDTFRESDRLNARSSIILYNGSAAFEAGLAPMKESKAAVFRVKKYSSPYEMSLRGYFSGNQLYTGNIPAGEYTLFLKIYAENGDCHMSQMASCNIQH